MPALFASHGAAIFTTAPGDPTGEFLRSLAERVAGWSPAAIVVISAHDAAHPLRMTGPGVLATIHDHPANAIYDYRYPGHGAQGLCDRVAAALLRAGHALQVDDTRGLDHGAWIPLSGLQPDGARPVAQLSLDAQGGAAEHLALGRALAPLRDEGVLLVGSGGVTHNQEVFRRGYFGRRDPADAEAFSVEFDAWVTELVTTRRGDDREAALVGFERHPLAAIAHPSVEHFLPLLVIAAAASDELGRKLFEGFQHSLSTSAFLFG
jgi:4,5-DOPA dioxygenase extradiol